MLSLDWDRKGRVTPVSTKSQEAWPGAEPGCQSPGESRCGAPEGERAPKVRASAPEAPTSGNVCRCARTTMKFAPLGAPLPRLSCEGRNSNRPRARLRRENAFACPPPRSETERGRIMFRRRLDPARHSLLAISLFALSPLHAAKGAAPHCAVRPPSSTNSAPVTKADSSASR